MIDWRGIFSAVVLALLLGAAPPARAQETALLPDDVAQEIAATASGEKKPGIIDKMVEGYTRYPGFFTFYHKAATGAKTLLLEVREKQLDMPFYLEATFSTGRGGEVMAGEPVQNFVLEFQRTPDDRLLLITPNLGFRARAGTPQAAAVARSFPAGFLAIFPIIATQPERKSLLIDVSALFTGDFTGISAYFTCKEGDDDKTDDDDSSKGTFTLDADMTFLLAVKSFPENAVVETQFHFKRTACEAKKAEEDSGEARGALADGRSLPVRVLYNLWQMPVPGYRPRLADSRVGYFVSGQINDQPAGFQSFDGDMRANPNVYYLNRWRLEKADPASALSPPKKPIVFWIDNSVPREYRETVREGILQWNAAFVPLGFTEAIVVKEQPSDAEWDHADLRYNVIRWVATPWQSSGVASEAIFREDPLTGEIVNAGIDINADLTRIGRLEERDVVLPGYTPPSARHAGQEHADYQQIMRVQGWYGLLALSTLQSDANGVDETAFTKALLKTVVGHEMGHALGLRHNFIGSTYLSPRELAQPANMISSSVMDYVPFNLFALNHPGAPYYNTSPGKYDLWAIEYGYTPFNATTPEAELPQLQAIAARGNEPGLAYGTDELADNYDPTIQRYDLGNDPLGYADALLALNNTLMRSLSTRLPKAGESYRQFTLNFRMLLTMDARAAEQTTRFIGGMYVRPSHRGDPHEQPPLLPVPGAKQQRALHELLTYFFTPDGLTVPRDYFFNLTGDPYGDSGAWVEGGYSLRTMLGTLQKKTLQELFDADRLARIANTEFTSPNDAFHLLDLFTLTSATIWSPLEKRQPIAPLQRDLQHAHLQLMLDMVCGSTAASVPPDARMLAWQTLRDLHTAITAALPAYRDDYSRIHLAEALSRIDLALAGKYSCVK